MFRGIFKRSFPSVEHCSVNLFPLWMNQSRLSVGVPLVHGEKLVLTSGAFDSGSCLASRKEELAEEEQLEGRIGGERESELLDWGGLGNEVMGPLTQ